MSCLGLYWSLLGLYTVLGTLIVSRLGGFSYNHNHCIWVVRHAVITTITTDTISHLLAMTIHQPPSLLSIPLEIRLEIYNHLLLLPPNVTNKPKPPIRYNYQPPGYCAVLDKTLPGLLVARVPTPEADRDADPILHPAILSVCAQTHAEASPLLYKHNWFRADGDLLTALPRLRSWYPPVTSPAMTSMIRKWHIRIKLDSTPAWPAAVVTSAFSGAHELVLELWQGTFFGGVGAEALRLFEGVRGVGKPRVTGIPPGFGGYVRWLVRTMKLPAGEEKVEYVPADEVERKRLDGWS